MREITQTEINAVSGAGANFDLPFENINNALSDISASLDKTLQSIRETSNFGEKLSLSCMALGLSLSKTVLSLVSRFMSDFVPHAELL